MTQLFNIRYNEDEHFYEMLIQKDSDGSEVWVRAATHWTFYRIPFPSFAEVRSLTLHEMLVMEGWTPPEV